MFPRSAHGTADPPPITHPEYFYGFLGIALAWQVLFILIARDPLRLRPAMPAAVLEKAAFGIAVIALFVHHRVSGPVLALGCIDLLLGAAMTAVYVGTARLARTP